MACNVARGVNKILEKSVKLLSLQSTYKSIKEERYVRKYFPSSYDELERLHASFSNYRPTELQDVLISNNFKRFRNHGVPLHVKTAKFSSLVESSILNIQKIFQDQKVNCRHHVNKCWKSTSKESTDRSYMPCVHIPRLQSDVSIPYVARDSFSTSLCPNDVSEDVAITAKNQLLHVEGLHLNIDDGKILYSGMPSKELLRSLFNLQLVASETLVGSSTEVLESAIMHHSLVRKFVHWLVKQTVYSHFCAGESVTEASATLTRMWRLGLRGILDYGLEDATENSCCEENLLEFLKAVHQTQVLPPGSVSFSSVKITAIVPLTLLERVSKLLRWQHQNGGVALPWKEEGLPFLSPCSPSQHFPTLPEPLTAEEERSLLLAQTRLHKLCEACEERQLPLLVDAEYSSVQPAIDYLTYAAALKFNKNARTIVYVTIQAYLKDSFPRLYLAVRRASEMGVCNFGVKLVRGAYITRETALANSLGFASPIHETVQMTHKCYDACAALMLEEISKGRGSIVLATHNENSAKAALLKATDLGLSPSDTNLQFAQLKGMADSLSLALVHAGCNVSKCLPFGPVATVIPYLIRRAEENRGFLGTASKDVQCIWQELKRRHALGPD